MAGKKSSDERKTSLVKVRFPQPEKERLHEDAALAGLTLSELVRRRTAGKPVLANVDLVMVRELRRIGGLLKHVHIASQGAYSAQTASTLGDLQQYIRGLSHDH